jgi:hypothetical protein
MGGKPGTIFARAGHEVVFSHARSPKKLEGLRGMRGGMKQVGDLTGKVIVSCPLPTKAAHRHL